MTNLQFTKMHGLGNDFVVINTINQSIKTKDLPISLIGDRHFGIGCDQILVIEPSIKADFFCRILNADGSEAEQCGNGLRCVARYLHETGLHSDSRLTLETIAGLFPIEIKDYDHIRVTLAPAGVETEAMQIPLPALGTVISGNSLSMGNPHFIIQVDDIKNSGATKVGPLVSTHSAFPEGTNVGFVQVINKEHIILRTFERGAGETHACGSNACAAVASGILDGRLGNVVNVEFKYGQLVIEWEGAGKPVYMTGPAAFVFTGELPLN